MLYNIREHAHVSPGKNSKNHKRIVKQSRASDLAPILFFTLCLLIGVIATCRLAQKYKYAPINIFIFDLQRRPINRLHDMSRRSFIVAVSCKYPTKESRTKRCREGGW